MLHFDKGSSLSDNQSSSGKLDQNSSSYNDPSKVDSAVLTYFTKSPLSEPQSVLLATAWL